MKRRITSSFASAAIPAVLIILVNSLIVCECLKLDADIDHDDVMSTETSLQKFISSGDNLKRLLDSTPNSPPYSNIHFSNPAVSNPNNVYHQLKSRRTNLYETYDTMSFYLAADSTLWLTAANSNNDQLLAHLFRFESSLNSFEFVEQLHTSRSKLFLNRFNPKIVRFLFFVLFIFNLIKWLFFVLFQGGR